MKELSHGLAMASICRVRALEDKEAPITGEQTF
jgi:hypothetical protein